jgi:hypothetical protein
MLKVNFIFVSISLMKIFMKFVIKEFSLIY